MNLRFPTARALSLALLAVCAASSAQAATIAVNDTSNTSGGSLCGLRNAIASANAGAAVGGCVLGGSSSPPHLIRLQAGAVYTLASVDNYWYGPNGLPAIGTWIEIDGRGATIERSSAAGTPAFRLFFVGADAASAVTAGYVSPGPGQLVLRHLTLRNGLAQGGGSFAGGAGAGMGGAVFNQGTLRLENVTATANIARGGRSCGVQCGLGGAGMGANAPSDIHRGGGFGGSLYDRLGQLVLGPAGGSGTVSGSGGGAGFAVGDNGSNGGANTAGNGGGANNGMGGHNWGAWDGSRGGLPGNGGGGGTWWNSSNRGGNGGDFGGGGGTGTLLTDGGSAGGPGGVGGGGGYGVGRGGNGGFGGGGSNLAGAGGFGGGGGDGSGDGGFGGGNGGGGGFPAPGGGAGLGGAVFNHNGRFVATNSTLSGNRAEGGVAFGGAAPGAGLGGAVFNLNGDAMLVHSTLAGNVVKGRNDTAYPRRPDAVGPAGGAVYHLGYDAALGRTVRLELVSSLLADSVTDTGAAASDLAVMGAVMPNLTNKSPAFVVYTRANLVESTWLGGAFHQYGNATVVADPQLAPLADNGGDTATQAIAPGSPALDAEAQCGVGHDQRGRSRPGGAACDLGAYEY